MKMPKARPTSTSELLAPASGVTRIRNSTRIVDSAPRARTMKPGLAGRFGSRLPVARTMASAIAASPQSVTIHGTQLSASQPLPLTEKSTTEFFALMLYQSRNGEMISTSPEIPAMSSPILRREVSKLVWAPKALSSRCVAVAAAHSTRGCGGNVVQLGDTQRVVDPIAEIEALTAFDGRQAGSDAERRAANHLQSRLTALGRDAAVEPLVMHPRWYLAHLAHALLAIGGSAISVENALVGTILVAIAAVSALGEISGRLPLASRLTGRRASQNVSAYDPASARTRPGTLILTAHYDSARTGAAFGRPDQLRARLGRLIRRPIGPAEPFAYSILLLLVTS